jgi:hypothetical protein
MNNPDNSASDEEKLKTPPMDYRTLLAVTRPLVITRPTSFSWGAPIFEDKAISLEARYWWADFTLRKGEIICSDLPIRSRQDEEGLTTTPALPQRGSDLRIRIHLGMS